jgi:hypothetical protein
MRRIPVAAIATAVALAGCPLPQPLPDYPAGTVTPPRILSASATAGSDSIIPVPAGCTTPPSGPSHPIDARIFYPSSVTVEARWFVDYRSDVPSRYAIQNTIREVPADPDPLVLERQVPTFTFAPYGFPPPTELGSFASWSAPGIVHVVELVVSNGFDTSETAPQPNRTPASTPDGATLFEIQTYRWVFVNVAGLPCP